MRNLIIFLTAALVVALPFIFREEEEAMVWSPGDPELVIISPHNEAIRYEFARAFSAWHEKEHGKPVRVDWRVIGGTSEITRYLISEYVSSYRGWARSEGKPWPSGASAVIVNRKFNPDAPSDSPDAALLADHYRTFRSTDAPEAFSTKIDLFFGGGEYDHSNVYRRGLTTAAWADGPPSGIFETEAGVELIPEGRSGEKWRSAGLTGTALSTFGICYNFDRLKDLGIDPAPSTWADLADPRLFGQLGVADPTKSGSISKAFEMLIHQECHRSVQAAGFDDATIAENEAVIREAGEVDPATFAAYQAAVESGWVKGLHLVQLIGANARYFTDSASKVPVDVSMGDAAAGIAIDFYGRYQAENSRAPDGSERMGYATPLGGSSVSCDPISLLRGAPNRELAVLFIEFVVGPEGQKLWNYQVGVAGGPHKYALRRLPIRRDFYPSDNAAFQASFEQHRSHLSDDFSDPNINPYELAEQFTYYSRWTGKHFRIHRDLIRAMCLDSGDELKAAWKAINEHGGAEARAAALAKMQELPPELTWQSALGDQFDKSNKVEYMREWTIFFRKNYREAKRLAEWADES